MESESPGVTRRDDSAPVPQLGWGTAFTLGLVTLILGVIVLARPTLSLIAIAVLLGIAMIVSGIYHIVRALDGREHERVWRGITGVLFLLAGLALLRHLHLSVALIGLFIGFTWIIQGVTALMESFSRGRRRTESGWGWSVFFGVISLIAGIVVVASPIASVAALTIFMGIWLIIIGGFEMFGALVYRRAASTQAIGEMRVPEQRSGVAATEGEGATSQPAPAQPGPAQDAAPPEPADESRPATPHAPG